METDSGHRKRVRHYEDGSHAHELTFSCYRRQAFLSRDRTREYLADAIVDVRARLPFHLWAYVFMPEHVHLLIWPEEGVSVSWVLKRIKQSVARRAMGYLRKHNPSGLRLLATGLRQEPYRFWQDGPGYDRNVLGRQTLHTMIDYIHANPVRRGLVSYPEEWKWSSAGEWVVEGTGPISIDRSSFPT
jgi:putative transposase